MVASLAQAMMFSRNSYDADVTLPNELHLCRATCRCEDAMRRRPYACTPLQAAHVIEPSDFLTAWAMVGEWMQYAFPMVLHAYGNKKPLQMLPTMRRWCCFSQCLCGVDGLPMWASGTWRVSPGLTVHCEERARRGMVATDDEVAIMRIEASLWMRSASAWTQAVTSLQAWWGCPGMPGSPSATGLGCWDPIEVHCGTWNSGGCRGTHRCASPMDQEKDRSIRHSWGRDPWRPWHMPRQPLDMTFSSCPPLRLRQCRPGGGCAG